MALFAACGWMSVDASAQKCKYLTDEADPMTEARVRRTKMTLLAEHGFSVASIKLGDETLTRVVKSKKASDTKDNARCILSD